MCNVDANPTDVAYKWQFNNSLKVFDLSYSQVSLRSGGNGFTVSFKI